MGSSRLNLLRTGAIAVLSFVAAFSFGWGVLATILVAVFAVIRRWRLMLAGPVVLGAIVTICTYILVWATPSEQQGVFELVRLLPRLVAYASIFVGAPIGASLASPGESSHFQGGVAGVLGLAGLILAACSMGPLIGPRELPKESATGRNYARLMVAFAAMCAAVTALGRVQFGLSQAVESQRYFILPCLFWLSLPVLLPALPVIGRWTRWLGWPAMLAGFGGILATTPHFMIGWTTACFGPASAPSRRSWGKTTSRRPRGCIRHPCSYISSSTTTPTEVCRSMRIGGRIGSGGVLTTSPLARRSVKAA